MKGRPGAPKNIPHSSPQITIRCSLPGPPPAGADFTARLRRARFLNRPFRPSARYKPKTCLWQRQKTLCLALLSIAIRPSQAVESAIFRPFDSLLFLMGRAFALAQKGMQPRPRCPPPRTDFGQVLMRQRGMRSSDLLRSRNIQ